MSLAILGSGWSNAQRGVKFPEVGISIRRWVVRYFSEINDKLPDNFGETTARAVSDKASREITVEGEISAASGGVLSIAFGAIVGYAFANKSQWEGEATTGALIMDEVTVTEERAGWRSLNMRITSNPNLT